MDTSDFALLALLGVYALLAVRRLKKMCGGDCGACRGCARAKE